METQNIGEEKQLTEQGQIVKEFLNTLLQKMNFEGCELVVTEDDEKVFVEIDTQDTGLNVVGFRGETLDALQYLASLVLGRDKKNFKRVVLDSEDFRQKREKTLRKLAKNLEQKVKRTGKPVDLEPMNPYERRIIHTTLQNSKFVETSSFGEGKDRHIVLTPKVVESDVLNAPTKGRTSLNFVYRSDKKKRR